MATIVTPEAERLAEELVKRLGDGPLTARELAAELVADDTPVELIGAFDDALSRTAGAGESDQLDARLWGPSPTAEQLVEARRAARGVLGEALERALSGALTREEAARQLGVTPQAVSKRSVSGGLVALRRGRVKWFPAWQFYEDGALPGLEKVIAAFPGSALSLTSWATSPSPDLDNATPAQTLGRRGGLARVLDAVAAMTPAAW
jgi:Protein of unknown function (DUF2384)